MTSFGMVIDLERCVGCYGCVTACKQCYGTRQGVNYNMMEYVEWGEYPDAHQRYLSTMCNHCADAPCVGACPTGASVKTEEGSVIVNFEECIGCGMCVEACPYGHRFLIKEDTPTSFADVIMPCEEESSKRNNVAEKCTFCYERVKDGLEPMCTLNCPGRCRIFGDTEDPESDISRYIAEKKPVHIEGTSMYYVLPEGMDRQFLPADLVSAGSEEGEPLASTGVESTHDAPAGIPGPAIAGAVGIAAAAAVGGVAYVKHKNSSTPVASDNE